MQFHLFIAVFCFASLRLSNARENQTEEMRDELSFLVRRVNQLEEALTKKDNEIMELQEMIEEIRNPPFGYFCSYQERFTEGGSVITYDKLLYSSQFGLQGDSPGIDINTGKFVSGFSGTWRVDFSLYTYLDPGQTVNIYLYKNGERIPEALFISYRSPDVTGYDYNTGGISVLLHLDLGDEVYLATTTMKDTARDLIFCVSLEQFDV